MNCEEFREIVHDVARDEEAPGSLALQDALEHAEQCAECDVLLGETEALSAGLRALANEHAEEKAPARVEAALLRVLQQNKPAAPRRIRVGLWAVVALSGVAAAAVFGFVLLRHSGPEPFASVGTNTESGIASAQSSAATGDAKGAAEEADAAFTADAADLTDGWPVTYQSASQGASQGQGAAWTGAFVPLSETFDPSLLDESTVMRVQMTRPALQKLGVYVEDLDNDGLVLADLAVSGEGTPEAIRVVQW